MYQLKGLTIGLPIIPLSVYSYLDRQSLFRENIWILKVEAK
jgi:hypothetical protein